MWLLEGLDLDIQNYFIKYKLAQKLSLIENMRLEYRHPYNL